MEIIMAAKTRNGNLLVWKEFLATTGRPINGTEAFYCTPDGDMMERKKSAENEVGSARKNWEAFEEFRVRGPLYEKLKKLFSDEVNILTFGGTQKESPFAALAKLKK
jgi:hypothetical protein